MDKFRKDQLARDLVEIHLPLERHVFPLLPRSKIPPRGMSWPTEFFTEAQLLNYVSRGYNLAWALGPQDIVLDVDPRKINSVGSFLRLEIMLGIAPGSLCDLTGVVNTGGADHGHHYYMSVPQNVKTETHCEDLPDLDFRHRGQYVVLPGSQHPDTGRYYEWDEFSPYRQTPMSMPQQLLDLLQIKPKEKNEKANIQRISVDELSFYLRQLDPKKFRTRQSWIELAFIAHSVCGGDGADVFLAWSQTDELYAHCEEENRRIWDSIKDDKRNNLGFGSLVQKVLDSGGRHYNARASVEFDDGFDFDKSRLDGFIEKLAKAPPSRSDDDAKKYIREASQFGLAMWDQKLRKEVSESLGLKTTTVDKFWRQIEREKEKNSKSDDDKIDYPEIIAQKVLKDHFKNGKTLIHAINQRFYHYVDTHWVPLLDNEITRLLYEASSKIKYKANANHEASAKVQPALTVLTAKTTKINDDVFNFVGKLKPIINCANGEIHIDIASGKFEFRKHSPESYLLQCLKTPFDPDAKCPVWDETLQGIFRDHKDPNGMIRHLYEIFGYIIQPQKNIASWFLWLGGGNNGKSITLEILQSLMGAHAYLPRSIHDFDKPGASNHAIASLVGKLAIVDDDANTEKPLPSSILKKLAEGRVWEANPKHKDQFNFRSSATPIVLSNGLPKIRDITWGMLRKVFVVPFKRIFVEGIDEDKTIQKRVEELELSGVLNRSLEGLRRLRLRGRFDPPRDCVDAKNNWLNQSNDILNWLYSYCIIGNGAWTSITQLYASYQIWADNNHRRYKQSIADLENHLFQRGFKIEIRGDHRGFIGLELK